MIRSTINGRKELYFAKVLAGMTYVMISLVLYVAPVLYIGLTLVLILSGYFLYKKYEIKNN